MTLAGRAGQPSERGSIREQFNVIQAAYGLNHPGFAFGKTSPPHLRRGVFFIAYPYLPPSISRSNSAYQSAPYLRTSGSFKNWYTRTPSEAPNAQAGLQMPQRS